MCSAQPLLLAPVILAQLSKEHRTTHGRLIAAQAPRGELLRWSINCLVTHQLPSRALIIHYQATQFQQPSQRWARQYAHPLNARIRLMVFILQSDQCLGTKGLMSCGGSLPSVCARRSVALHFPSLRIFREPPIPPLYRALQVFKIPDAAFRTSVRPTRQSSVQSCSYSIWNAQVCTYCSHVNI